MADARPGGAVPRRRAEHDPQVVRPGPRARLLHARRPPPLPAAPTSRRSSSAPGPGGRPSAARSCSSSTTTSACASSSASTSSSRATRCARRRAPTRALAAIEEPKPGPRPARRDDARRRRLGAAAPDPGAARRRRDPGDHVQRQGRRAVPPPQASRRGAQGFVGKPFDPQQLIDADEAARPPDRSDRTRPCRARGSSQHRVASLDPVFVWLSRIGTWGAVWLALAARRSPSVCAGAPSSSSRSRRGRSRPTGCRVAAPSGDRSARQPPRSPPEPQPLATSRTRLVPVRPRDDRASRARPSSRAVAALRRPRLSCSRRAIALLARLRRRALAARRARRRGARCRYSSSAARSSPATISSDRRDQADEDPDPAAGRGEERVRDRDDADEHEDRRERAERDEHEALGHGRRQLDPGLAERLEDERREPDEEDELAERARVPAGDRQRQPVGLRCPAYQSVNAEIASTSPAIQASRSPQ